MTPEVIQQIIKRGGVMVLVCALAVGGYFVYDMMHNSSSATVATDDWDDRDSLDDFLGSQTGGMVSSQTGAIVSSGSQTGMVQTGSQTGMVQIGSHSGGTLEREGEVISNIVIGSGDTEIGSGDTEIGSGDTEGGSGQTVSSGDVESGGSGKRTIEDIFDQLLGGLPISGDMTTQSGVTNTNGSGQVLGSMGLTENVVLLSGQTTGGDAGGSGSMTGFSETGQLGSLQPSGVQPSSMMPQSSGATVGDSSEVLFGTGAQSSTGSQSSQKGQASPTTLPVSDEQLMDHYRQRKKTQ